MSLSHQGNTLPQSATSGTDVSAQQTSNDKPEVDSVMMDATNELVAYSYRILDQCVTLCDAVDEVKRNALVKVYPHSSSGGDHRDHNETVNLVTSWKTKVANFGCDLVQLTADIRLSPLVDHTEDHGRQVQEQAKATTGEMPRSSRTKAISSTRSATSSLDAKVSELSRPARFPTKTGPRTVPLSGKKGSRNQLVHHQLQERQSSRHAGPTSSRSMPAANSEETLDSQRQISVGFTATSDDTAKCPTESETIPVPPSSKAPFSTHRRHPHANADDIHTISRLLQLRAANADEVTRLQKEIIDNHKLATDKPGKLSSSSNLSPVKETDEDMTSYHRETIMTQIARSGKPDIECDRRRSDGSKTGNGEPTPRRQADDGFEHGYLSRRYQSGTKLSESLNVSNLINHHQPATPASLPSRGVTGSGETSFNKTPSSGAPCSKVTGNTRHGDGANCESI